jgi:hypothetical protein
LVFLVDHEDVSFAKIVRVNHDKLKSGGIYKKGMLLHELLCFKYIRRIVLSRNNNAHEIIVCAINTSLLQNKFSWWERKVKAYDVCPIYMYFKKQQGR